VEVTPDHEPVDTRSFPSSWRLTFRYDEDGTVELAEQEAVPMVAPGSPGPIRTGGGYSGSWVELQDQQGRVLIDYVLHDPFRRLLAVHYRHQGGRQRTRRRALGPGRHGGRISPR
jgi:hypothetical protein